MPLRGKHCHYLIVEDNRDEAFILESAIGRLPLKATHALCRNLSEAKDYLRGAGMYSDREKFPLPNIILCDLHIGVDSGLDLVDWVKQRPELKNVHITILTGSSSPADFTEGLGRGATQVIAKPFDPGDLRSELIALTERFFAVK